MRQMQCRRVEVTHKATGRRWDFGCYGWIDAECGFQRTLTLEAYAHPGVLAGPPRPNLGLRWRPGPALHRSDAALSPADRGAGGHKALHQPYHQPYLPLAGSYTAAAAAPSEDGGEEEEEEEEQEWGGGRGVRARPSPLHNLGRPQRTSLLYTGT